MLLFFSTSLQENSINFTNVDNNIQSNSKSIFQAKLETTKVDRFKYQDGEVLLLQNQLKLSDFYFTPFPHIEPNLTECYYNELSGHNELSLSISLYTPHLLDSIKRHVQQHQNICRTEYCDVSLLPLHSIRLFQKGLRTSESKNKYTLDDEWYSNVQLRQSMEFIIYTSDMFICENLKYSIASRCRLSNFEVQYLLHGQQIVARKLEIISEYITGTFMYNQLRSHFPLDKQDLVALTSDDYKNLLAEIIDQITINLRAEEDYESLQDPFAIDRILDRQLKYKQVQLKEANDHLWNSLYWTSELTRPDRLSNILNKIIQRDATEFNKFRYDYSQANEDMKQNLKYHERQKLDDLEKYLATRSQNTVRTTNMDTLFEFENSDNFSDLFSATERTYSLNDLAIHRNNDLNWFNSTDNSKKNSTMKIIQRKDVEKLLHYLSEHIQLEGDIVKPKPIDVKFVKFSSLNSNTILFSNSILVKTRTDVHVLPLRCPYEYRQHPAMNTWLADKYDRLSSVVDNFTNVVHAMHEKLITDFTKTITEFETLQSLREQRTNLSIQQLVNTSNNQMIINQLATMSAMETRLTQKLETMNIMETRLIQKIDASKCVTNSTVNQVENRLHEKITGNFYAHNTLMAYVLSKLAGNLDFNKQSNESVNRFGTTNVLESIFVVRHNPLMVKILFRDKTWFQGMVCDDNFNQNAALIACRSQNNSPRIANFSTTYWEPNNSCEFGFGQISMNYKCNFILDGFNCNSNSSTSLAHCDIPSVFKHDCNNHEHINLVCTY